MKNKFIGKILKCSDYRNELWYFSPFSNKRELITIVNINLFLKKLFILINEQDLVKIPRMDELENNKYITFRRKLKGKFIILEKNILPIWYVNNDLKRVEVTFFDLLDLLSNYAIDITKEELKLIPQ